MPPTPEPLAADPNHHHDELNRMDTPERIWLVPEFRAAAISGLLLGLAWLVGRLGSQVGESLLQLGSLVIGGKTFVPEAVRTVASRRLNIGVLMALAAGGALILGEWGEAASLAFLFSISEGLEGYSLRRTRHGLRSVLELVPSMATVVLDGRESTTPVGALRPGQVMVVRPGQRAATDGTIRTGRSTLDLSIVTGESIPVEVGPGDRIFAGALNGSGALEVEVTAAAEDNTLARMVRLVEEAQDRKGATQRLADRIARPLVPGVLICAILLAVVGSLLGTPEVWIRRSLVVLVAAAPCAFALSVPVAAVSAIGAATRRGVLIKGGAAIEALAKITAAAFDKTGTLTYGRPQVVEVVPCVGTTRDNVLEVAASLEARSEHPLASAILATQVSIVAADNVEAIPGKGLVGIYRGRPARLGRPGYIDAQDLALEVERLQAAGHSVVLVELGGRLIGAVGVRDELRTESAEAVRALRSVGIERIVMLTGDHQRAGDALGKSAGIDEVYAELLPEQKVEEVQKIRRRQPVMMVGDGVNDAPALAAADIGVAMGAAGTAAAAEAADIALMGDDLRMLAPVVLHTRNATRILRQNLVMSGAIILTLIPLAATGVLGLAAVVLSHELAEVVVIANGVRANTDRWFGRPRMP